ncbi:MAG: DUF4330 domain-containing protein [Coleofasciculaceae cyanobacterium]
MAILDSKGRLFGKVSILDFGAALVILLVIVGIFFFPGTSGSVAQLNGTKPVELDVLVRGLNVSNPQELIAQFNEEKKTNIIIRNQPYGQLNIKSVKTLQRNLAVPQPDGSLKVVPDPRRDSSESFSTDMLMVLTGQATINKDGPVLGNSKVRIGTTLELEGSTYNFNGSVIGMRIK